MNNNRLIPICFAVYPFLHLSTVNVHAKNSQLPNIIIIMADDMGYGDISSNNPLARTETPNINKMAQNGVVFTDAHSGGAVSIPSRYGIITGRYYFRAPEFDKTWGYFPPLIEQNRETIGTVLQKAGYTTACIGKWHLGLNWELKDASKSQNKKKKDITYTNTDFTKNISGGPNSLGFNYSFILPASLDMPPYVFIKDNKVVDTDIVLVSDAYPNKLANTIDVWDRKYTNDNDVYWERGVWWRNGEMSKSFKFEDCHDIFVSEGISFIKNQVKNNHQKPFMLYLPLAGPHTPWLPNNEFKGKSKMGTYGDFILQIDNVVAQINNTLKSLGIDENTIVIFSSDNGSAWQEDDNQAYAHQSNYSLRGQKGDIWDGGHRVPLIVQWPAKIKRKFIYSHTVSLLDLIATFSDLTSQSKNKMYGEDSFSFYKVLENQINKAIRDNIIYISSRDKLAIQKDEWKFIDVLGSAGFSEPREIQPVKNGPSGQLYKMDTDPLEMNNLYLLNTEKVKELSELLNKLMTQGYSNPKFK